jgi:hypothetical protein
MEKGGGKRRRGRAVRAPSPSTLPKKERRGLGACDGEFVSRGEKTARDRRDIPIRPHRPGIVHIYIYGPRWAVNVVAVDMVMAAVVERPGCGGGFTLT